jgi:aminoglycoside phosphotransferase (APT) family kinase protein
MPEHETALRDLIDSIPAIRDASVIRQLHGSKVSEHWHLELGGKEFVLRIDRPLAGGLGLDRPHENEILGVVGNAGIGPSPVWSDPARGIQVCTYLPGESWTREDVLDSGNLEELARTLASLHRLDSAGPAFDAASAAQRYVKQIGSRQATRLAAEASGLFHELESDRVASALCHNDLVHGNIICSAPDVSARESAIAVKLIDWEYAAVGDPLFDLATVIRHHDLPGSLAEGFLAAYQRYDLPVDRPRLNRYGRLYDLLSALWYLSMVEGSGPDSPFRYELDRVLLRLKTMGRGPGDAPKK